MSDISEYLKNTDVGYPYDCSVMKLLNGIIKDCITEDDIEVGDLVCIDDIECIHSKYYECIKPKDKLKLEITHE